MSPRKPFSNQLLTALSDEDFAPLEAHLEPIELKVRGSVDQANQPIRHIVFPLSGIVSLIAHEGEYQLEVGIVGREGMTGAPLVLGVDKSPQESFVQVAGEGVRISVAAFKRALAQRPTLRAPLLLYVHALLQQTAQTALANGRCTIEERLARWLLMVQDRIGGNDVPLQQLEGDGAIRNVRGLITIRDRHKLEDLAGGAYRPPQPLSQVVQNG